MFKISNEIKLLKVNKLMYYGIQFVIIFDKWLFYKVYIEQWIPKQGAPLSFIFWCNKVKVMIFLWIHLKMLVVQVIFKDYIKKKNESVKLLLFAKVEKYIFTIYDLMSMIVLEFIFIKVGRYTFLEKWKTHVWDPKSRTLIFC